MPNLTKKQLDVAACLAADRTWKETTAETGVAKSTISRWTKMADFQEEVNKRKKIAVDIHRANQEEAQQRETSEFYSGLEEYRKALIQVHRAQVSLGGSMLNKMKRRFTDLPDEAFAAKDLPGMFNTASTLLKDGFAGWAELIGLDEVMRQLEEDGTEDSG